MKNKLTISVVAITTLVAATVLANIQVTHTTKTAVSGNSGVEHVVAFSASDGFMLTGLKVGENSDRPCLLTIVGQRLVNGGAEASSKQFNLPGCETNGLGGLKSISFQSPGDGSLRVTGSLEVCTSDKSSSSANRMKGAKIHARKVDTNARVTADAAVEEYHQNNCKEWHPLVACPADQVAVGVVLELTSEGEYGSIQGMRLQCASIAGSVRP